MLQGTPTVDDDPRRSAETGRGKGRLHPHRDGKVAKFLPRSGEDYHSGLRDAVLRASRGANGFVTGKKLRSVRRGVENNYGKTFRREMLGKKKPEGFLDHVRVRLIGKTQYTDDAVGRLLRTDEVRERGNLGAIEAVSGVRKIGECAGTGSEGREGTI